MSRTDNEQRADCSNDETAQRGDEIVLKPFDDENGTTKTMWTKPSVPTEGTFLHMDPLSYSITEKYALVS